MKLFYAPDACSLADHIALAESGLTYDLDKVDLKAKTVESGGDYSAINPKGYVPALELDDGTIITENIAILSYLADRVGALLPASGIAHIRALELLAFISTEIHKSFKPFHNPAASDAEKDEAQGILAKRFAYLSESLGTKPYLFGTDLTVVDGYAYVMLRWTAKFGIEVPENLREYAARMRARPAVAKALGEEGLD